MIITSTTKFKATLTADDKRTGYKQGMTFDPLGAYWNKSNVILVGSRGGQHGIK